MSSLAPLFRPYSGGGLALRNRLVMAPMTRQFSSGHVPGADVAAHYRRRVEGGVRLVVTEGIGTPHPAAIDAPDIPQIAGPGPENGWRHVVAGVPSGRRADRAAALASGAAARSLRGGRSDAPIVPLV